MLRLVRLLLPALFPSWRFFKEVEASPRIQWRVDEGPWRAAVDWPDRVGPGQTIIRLFANSDWNEALYLLSCAERLLVAPTARAEIEIRRRIARRHGIRSGLLEIRIEVLERSGTGIVRSVAFEGGPRVVGTGG